jgi:succinate-semialdehyde dehydrogenase/glutarate-semialdehyde dehydrogenase
VLVFDDVDVENVLDMSAAGKFRNAGQVCVSPTRFYVHESIYTKFVEGLTARAKALPVGDGLVETNRMGPLAHAGRLTYIEPLLEDARRCGAKVHTGGSRRAGPGNFFEPTVISDVPKEARIMNDEPFGPIAIVNSFSTIDEAIGQANRLAYGLAAYAFTHSAKISSRVAAEIESGMVGINSFLVSVPESPFGGVKDSGHGSEEGIEGLEACLVTKFVAEME